jgi:hypothetical protein
VVAEGDDDVRRIGSALDAYELGEPIGEGAFARVFSGRHRYIGRPVAIKVLDSQFTHDAQVRHRFEVEAQVLGRLNHPHIVKVFDYVEQDDVCAFIMERLPGGTAVSRGLAGKDPKIACAVVVATLSALQYAHNRAVVHRDIKPSNVMFSSRHVVKVGDFGIARIIGANTTYATAPGAFLGTPMYMAPEQVISGDAGPQIDTYAAGVMLYELLAGVQPFDPTGGYLAVAERRLTERPPRPLVPAALADVVMRSLERELADRYPSAHAFATALVEAGDRTFGPGWIDSTELGVTLPDGPGNTVPDPGPSRQSDGARTTVRPARLRIHKPRFAAAVGLLLAAALVPALVFGNSAGPHPLPPSGALVVDGHDLHDGGSVDLDVSRPITVQVGDASELVSCSRTGCTPTSVRLRLLASGVELMATAPVDLDARSVRVEVTSTRLLGPGRKTGELQLTERDVVLGPAYRFPADVRGGSWLSIPVAVFVLCVLLAGSLIAESIRSLRARREGRAVVGRLALAGATLAVATQIAGTLFFSREPSLIGAALAASIGTGAGVLAASAVRMGRRSPRIDATPQGDDRTHVVPHRQQAPS